MIRALYTAASGMNAQQTNIDNVAHNLANVNTTGFKKSRDRVRGPRLSGDADGRYADVGHDRGADRPGDRSRHARGRHGAQLQHRQPAIDERAARPRDRGRGFFQIALPDGTTGYTRAGTFHLDAHGLLRDGRGLSRSSRRSRSRPTRRRSASRRTASSRPASPARQAAQQLGTIELATFPNPAGLRPLGGNLFTPTTASGDPKTGVPGTDGSARSRRASSRTRTSASSRKWST